MNGPVTEQTSQDLQAADPSQRYKTRFKVLFPAIHGHPRPAPYSVEDEEREYVSVEYQRPRDIKADGVNEVVEGRGRGIHRTKDQTTLQNTLRPEARQRLRSCGYADSFVLGDGAFYR